jgi:LmbE family N-acetylglucosaminyl deacetylase
MIKKCLILSLFAAFSFFAHALEDLPKISKEDKILILAPHPDDEVIGCAGLIQKASKAGSKVKVVYFTDGEHNQLSFLFYEKRVVFKQKDFIHIAKERKKEALSVVEFLGLKKKDIFFLGYPDLSTFLLLSKYWDKNKPFKDIFTSTSKTSQSSFSPNSDYLGQNIIRDLKKIILEFKPDKIFLSHPGDTNSDHFSLYAFMQVSLWDLQGRIEQPRLYSYLVHYRGWPKQKGYDPSLGFDPPEDLKEVKGQWYKLDLDADEIVKKYNAINKYKSQISYSKRFLDSFARKNELFFLADPIKVNKGVAKEGISYDINGKNLDITVKLLRKAEKDLRISFYLFGYSRNKSFELMPKLYLSAFDGRVKIRDKKKRVIDRRLKYSFLDKKTFQIKVPLDILSKPDYLIVQTRSDAGGILPKASKVWSVIELGCKK